MKSLNIILELMTSQEKLRFIAKGMRAIKKPGGQSVTFSKNKEKGGESVTVADVTDFNNALTESILLPVGNKGIFFEQDDETVCGNYDPISQTCKTGCSNIGVDKGNKCPYIGYQPKCPCYREK